MADNVPQYDHQVAHINDNKQPSTLVATSILIVVTTLAVTGRLAAQWMVQPRLLADDYCVIIALILSLGLCATLIACVKYGLGQHVIAVEKDDPNPPENLVNVFKTGYAITVIAIPDLFFIKLSLLIFYHRIFRTSGRCFKIALLIMVGYVTAWTVAALVVYIDECTPISLFWDRAYGVIGMKLPTTGSCLPVYSHQAAPGILNSVSDLLILVLPGVALWPLQMRRTKKLGLFLMFSLGAFVCGVSVVKIVSVFAVNNDVDPSYKNTEIVLWTVVECGIGLVCACLPCMMPLSRIFRMGPKAAFKHYGSKAGRPAMRMQNFNPPPFPGGRRLDSEEDVERILRSENVPDDETQARNVSVLPDGFGGGQLPWEQDRHGRLHSTVMNEAVGGHAASSASEIPLNSIMVENAVQLKSEKRQL